MKTARLSLAIAFLAACPALAAAQDPDIEKLHKLAKQARAELEALRKQVGSEGERGEGRGERGEGREGREGRGEHGGRREGRGEHGEGREGRGEHGGRGEGKGEHSGGGERREGKGERGEGEEGGKRIGKRDTWNATRNGAHLILAFNPESRSFKGTVTNRTKKVLEAVRVEVHLSNGVELGPTKRTDLKPGQKMKVELAAANQKFEWWTTHPETGSEEGHNHEGSEGKGKGKEGADDRPKDGKLRPIYNELQLLRQEVRMLSRGLRAKRGGREGRERRRR